MLVALYVLVWIAAMFWRVEPSAQSLSRIYGTPKKGRPVRQPREFNLPL